MMSNEEVRQKLEVFVHERYSVTGEVVLIRLRDQEYQQLLQVKSGKKVGIINTYQGIPSAHSVMFTHEHSAVAVRILRAGKVSEHVQSEPVLAETEPIIVLRLCSQFHHLHDEFPELTALDADILITGGAQNMKEFLRNKYGGIRVLPENPEFFVRVYEVLGVFEVV